MGKPVGPLKKPLGGCPGIEIVAKESVFEPDFFMI